MKVKGRVELLLTRADGSFTYLSGKNLVVTAGLGLIASRMCDANDATVGYMAIGSSATVTTATMTTLVGTEHERVATSNSHSGADVTYTATFGSGLGSLVTINEIGLFNATPGGTMLARFLTTEFTLNSGETLSVTWTLTFED